MLLAYVDILLQFAVSRSFTIARKQVKFFKSFHNVYTNVLAVLFLPCSWTIRSGINSEI